MPIIDQAVFEELKDISGEEFINELIDAFLEDAPSMIREMRQAVQSRDVESLRRNAHSLKSNANTFGATELGILAKELEYMARDNNLDVGDRLDVLDSVFADVAEELGRLRA